MVAWKVGLWAALTAEQKARLTVTKMVELWVVLMADSMAWKMATKMD